MGLFSKSKNNTLVKEESKIETVNETPTYEVNTEDETNGILKDEMAKLSQSSSSISSAVQEVNSSLSSLTNATLSQAEELGT
ncbi:MAG: chemotaxis protein, partial [Clostridium sp.]|nr:chemotaxis protein [Clostridium sp.]